MRLSHYRYIVGLVHRESLSGREGREEEREDPDYGAGKFPDRQLEFPVPSAKFPVPVSREFRLIPPKYLD
jgi:hypothetical protein